ncbi:MAG: hypothetical protein WC797_04830 [Candidatus Paceibacterota bacterium]
MKKIILVVCRGNIVRSPFAEAVINKELARRGLDSKMQAISRGIQGTPVDPVPDKFSNISFYPNEFRNAKPILDKLGIDTTKHVSKPVDKKTAESASVIFAMDEKNYQGLNDLFPDLKDKIHLLSELVGKKEAIEDPENESVEKSTNVLLGINDTILSGFPRLLELVGE